MTPLWHGVELCRDLATGDVAAGATALHVGYLVVLVLVGLALAVRGCASGARAVSTVDTSFRILPRLPLGTRRSWRLVERNLASSRDSWLVFVSGFFEPLFYLLALGVGVGALVGDLELGGETVSYRDFVAPALLAASAMNGPLYESGNVFFKLNYAKTYEGVLATPLTVRDVALGELIYTLLRGTVYAVGFVAVMLVLGVVHSWWAVFALPAALLISAAFAAAGVFSVTLMRSWADFAFVEVATLPMFLFSATFVPADEYPAVVTWLLPLTPLYHGVELLRSLTLGYRRLARARERRLPRRDDARLPRAGRPAPREAAAEVAPAGHPAESAHHGGGGDERVIPRPPGDDVASLATRGARGRPRGRSGHSAMRRARRAARSARPPPRRVDVAASPRHLRPDEAGMERDDMDPTCAQLVREVRDREVERRLRHPVAVHSARGAVADRARHARDEADSRAAIETRQQHGHDAQRPERVDVELLAGRVEVDPVGLRLAGCRRWRRERRPPRRRPGRS